MPNDSPLVIAHRATMGHAPENTLLGVRRALELGCDGVEIDVRLCADGVPVLIHDALLDRTTDASGAVAEATLDDLSQIDAGGGESIPTLTDALNEIAGQMLLVIELKTSPGDDVAALCDAVLAEVTAMNALPWTWLWSFDPNAVRTLAERAPKGRRIAHLCGAPTKEVWQAVEEYRLDGLSMYFSAINESTIAACRAHDAAAFAWTVNEADEIARLIKLGLTGIVGDYPERIQSAMAQ